MAYANLRIDIDCSDLGDGCYIVIRNPVLVPPEELIGPEVPLNDSGQPVNPAEWRKSSRSSLGKLVIAWQVWDEEGNELPLPKDDPTVMDRVPQFVIKRIDDQYIKAMVPPKADQAATTGKTS